jgi:hypothetical protein
MPDNRTLAHHLSSLRQLFGIEDGGRKRDPINPAELRQFCLALRNWVSLRRDELLDYADGGRSALAKGSDFTPQVQAAWQHLISVAGNSPYPAFEAGPYPSDKAAAALDRIAQWCDRRVENSPQPAGAPIALHELIDQLYKFINAVSQSHQAMTQEERAKVKATWPGLTGPFWATHRIPTEALRGLADPAIAWCSQKGFSGPEYVAIIEKAADSVIALAKRPPYGDPSVYSNPKEAQPMWERQGERLLRAQKGLNDLRRLAAQAGAAWQWDSRLPWDPTPEQHRPVAAKPRSGVRMSSPEEAIRIAGQLIKAASLIGPGPEVTEQQLPALATLAPCLDRLTLLLRGGFEAPPNVIWPASFRNALAGLGKAVVEFRACLVTDGMTASNLHMIPKKLPALEQAVEAFKAATKAPFSALTPPCDISTRTGNPDLPLPADGAALTHDTAAALRAALETLVTQLRRDWRILFDKAWDYPEGLNATVINNLAMALGRGPVFELELTKDRRQVKVHHPDSGKPAITWTVWSKGWEYIPEVQNDREAARNNLQKIRDTIDYLQGWRGIAAQMTSAELGVTEAAVILARPNSEAPSSPSATLAREIVPGVQLASLLPAEGELREVDALGSVRDNLRIIETALAGRKTSLVDAQTLIRRLWEDLEELVKRGIGQYPPSAPTDVVTWDTAERTVHAAKDWLESLPNPIFAPAPSKEPPHLSLIPEIDQESQALALLFQHPDWSIAKIADHLKVARNTPYKWKRFRDAAEKAGKLKPRGEKGRVPRRGHKTPDGRVEAYDVDGEEE